MATIFSAPTIGEPRAVGIKNGGIQQVETDIVRPMSRLSTSDDTWQPGKQMEFRWRSDSSRYWSPRDTKLYVKYQLQFGAPNEPSSDIPAVPPKAAPLDMSINQDKVRSVRVTAAPNTALFDGGMRYLQNNVTVEHQPHPYTSAMAQLLTKTDIAGTDTGSAGLLSLRKDVNKKLLESVPKGRVKSVELTQRIAAPGPPQVAAVTEGDGATDASAAARAGFGVVTTGVFVNVPTTCFTLNPADGSLVAKPTATGLTLQVFNNGGSAGIDIDSIGVSEPGSGYEAGDVIKFDFSAGSKSPHVTANGGSTPTGDKVFFLQHDATPFQTVITETLLGEMSRDNKADNVNPKQEIVTAGVDTLNASTKQSTTFEYLQPMFLASWQHGFAVGPSDHQLFLTISNDWHKDLLHCPEIAGHKRAYSNTVVGTSHSRSGTAAQQELAQGAVRIYIEEVELHIAYVKPTQQFIPPSQSLRFSQYQVDTRVVDSRNVNESLVVNPGTRQLLFGMRQEEHGIAYDREEFGLAMAGIDETGTGGAIRTFTDFQAQLGGVVAPTVAFSNMSPGKAHMARPYQEFMNVIGKPLGLRGNSLTYAQYIGSHNSNGSSGPGKGDHGPIIALRLLTPESELSNELQIRGQLNDQLPSDGTERAQQMVIITIADRLLDIQ
jgi:hypothetical protein